MAALIKSIMILKGGLVPGNINLQKLKPSLQIAGRSIQIPTQTVPLTDKDYDTLHGHSSFSKEYRCFKYTPTLTVVGVKT